MKLKSAISQLNMERPAALQFSDEQCRIKFLSLIDAPQSLVDKATEEMQRGTYKNAAGAAGFHETAAGFDELWRINFARGSIKYAPPPQQGERDTNRVDAMLIKQPQNVTRTIRCCCQRGESQRMLAMQRSRTRKERVSL